MRSLAPRESAASLPLSSHFDHARAILIYLAMPDEVDLTSLGKDAISRGIAVAAPRLSRVDRSLTPVVISNFDADLAPVAFLPNLREPRAGLPALPLDQLSHVLVPGLAFDRAGRRLGRGAGYYDRFLPRLPPTTLIIGVCFDYQIIDHVPTEAHDVRMHALLTPSVFIPIP